MFYIYHQLHVGTLVLTAYAWVLASYGGAQSQYNHYKAAAGLLWCKLNVNCCTVVFTMVPSGIVYWIKLALLLHWKLLT